jgi:(p)ppGpp synthase/HD superfamily hydrolase
MKLFFAKLFCKLAHFGQRRKYTGDPYHVHPIEVMNLLKGAGIIDEDILIGALLHDTVEDVWWCNFKIIQFFFGPVVANIIWQVTNASLRDKYVGNRSQRKEYDRSCFIRDCDVAGVNIKLGDFISNMATLKKYDPDFANIYFHEKAFIMEKLAVTKAYAQANVKLKNVVMAIMNDHFHNADLFPRKTK